ncbi:hypothetical protein OpiT1DRAFT_04092 [Opitutaceae bacterium TAV1]|nr:hypothetical protein OpiT1DRAFT_04092 [Opitutaceae bacterium TAV1]
MKGAVNRRLFGMKLKIAPLWGMCVLALLPVPETRAAGGETAGNPAAADPFAGPPVTLERFASRFAKEGEKWGGPAFWLEALLVNREAAGGADGADGKKSLSAPTPEMLAAGLRLRVRLQPGLAAGQEQVTVIDRTPAGVPLAGAPRKVGTRLYAFARRVEPAAPAAAGDHAGDAAQAQPSYDVAFNVWHAVLSGFVETGEGVQGVFASSEVDSRAQMAAGRWMVFGGLTREEASRAADGKEKVQKRESLVWLRIVDGSTAAE